MGQSVKVCVGVVLPPGTLVVTQVTSRRLSSCCSLTARKRSARAGDTRFVTICIFVMYATPFLRLLLRGRGDDKPDTIKKRFGVFRGMGALCLVFHIAHASSPCRSISAHRGSVQHTQVGARGAIRRGQKCHLPDRAVALCTGAAIRFSSASSLISIKGSSTRGVGHGIPP